MSFLLYVLSIEFAKIMSNFIMEMLYSINLKSQNECKLVQPLKIELVISAWIR